MQGGGAQNMPQLGFCRKQSLRQKLRSHFFSRECNLRKEAHRKRGGKWGKRRVCITLPATAWYQVQSMALSHKWSFEGLHELL